MTVDDLLIWLTDEDRVPLDSKTYFDTGHGLLPVEDVEIRQRTDGETLVVLRQACEYCGG